MRQIKLAFSTKLLPLPQILKLVKSIRNISALVFGGEILQHFVLS